MNFLFHLISILVQEHFPKSIWYYDVAKTLIHQTFHSSFLHEDKVLRVFTYEHLASKHNADLPCQVIMSSSLNYSFEFYEKSQTTPPLPHPTLIFLLSFKTEK